MSSRQSEDPQGHSKQHDFRKSNNVSLLVVTYYYLGEQDGRRGSVCCVCVVCCCVVCGVRLFVSLPARKKILHRIDLSSLFAIGIVKVSCYGIIALEV
jgi:hypothetical protein